MTVQRISINMVNMKKNYGIAVLLVTGLMCAGCASVRKTVVDSVVEISRSIWGSSTRALEESRDTAIRRTFQCSFSDCFDAVILLTQTDAPAGYAEDTGIGLNPEEEEDDESSQTPVIRKILDLFLKDKWKGIIVVMGVPGNVDTTEVGIFFTPWEEGSVQVEIASLSKYAKITVSEIVFKELKEHYRESAP